jgi:hypothetical protein
MQLIIKELENSVILEVSDQVYHDHQLELEEIDTLYPFDNDYSLVLGKVIPKKSKDAIPVVFSGVAKDFPGLMVKYLYFSKVKRLKRD